MAVRGVRGAITVGQDTEPEVLAATRDLLLAICAENPELDSAEIASIFFTVTEDVHAVYPARAARELGWGDVPLMCAREIVVPGGLTGCIRVLIHWNTDLRQDQIHHVYLRGAVVLRPDLVAKRVQGSS